MPDTDMAIILEVEVDAEDEDEVRTRFSIRPDIIGWGWAILLFYGHDNTRRLSYSILLVCDTTQRDSKQTQRQETKIRRAAQFEHSKITLE